MAVKQIVDGLWEISLGAVNAFLIDDGELTLIDTGIPGSADTIVTALAALGKKPADIRHIVVTHCHPDHAGSLAALKRLTSATVYMHPVDAALVRRGQAKRSTSRPAPGVLRHVLFWLFVRNAPLTIEAAEIEREVPDGTRLPIAGGLDAIHVPGHCAGQIALLWSRRRVLFAADAAANMPRLGLSLGYEDLNEGVRSLEKLATLDFEIACFGHGKAITRGAAAEFKKRWGKTP